MVRCFIGIEIPDDIKKYVTTIQNKLKLLPMNAKFVEYENLHISLSFLGDIDMEVVENVSKALDKIGETQSEFPVVIDGVKFIPNKSFLRVIALDIVNDDVENLRKKIVKAVGGDSKPPHLTLCRVKNVFDRKNFERELLSIDVENKIFIANEITLFKSVLQKTGPIYSIIHKSKLK